MGSSHQPLCCWWFICSKQNGAQKPKIWLKPWHMGFHLRVLIERYPMNTNRTRFRWFSKTFVSLCLDERSLRIGLCPWWKMLLSKIYQQKKKKDKNFTEGMNGFKSYLMNYIYLIMLKTHSCLTGGDPDRCYLNLWNW